MAINKCRQCQLPLTENEAAGDNCPVCGTSFIVPTETPLAAAPEAATAPGISRPYFFAALVLVALLAMLFVWREVRTHAAFHEMHEFAKKKTADAEQATADAESARQEMLSAKAKQSAAEQKRAAAEKGEVETLDKLQAAEVRAAEAEKKTKGVAAQLKAAEAKVVAAEKALALEKEMAGVGGGAAPMHIQEFQNAIDEEFRQLSRMIAQPRMRFVPNVNALPGFAPQRNPRLLFTVPPGGRFRIAEVQNDPPKADAPDNK